MRSSGEPHRAALAPDAARRLCYAAGHFGHLRESTTQGAGMKKLITTADHLKAYSRGEISSRDAINGIGASGYRELLHVMCDCGIPLPRGNGQERDVAAEVEDVVPLLKRQLDLVAKHP